MSGGGRTTLSVCCQTRGAGARVAAMLGMFRPVADEIVVAADARTEPGDLSAYAAAADRVIRYEYRGGARDAAWLHRQCSGDWILWIAGDEVPSRSLIDQLPALISSRETAHYWLPTGWLFPDAGHFLIEEPWWPDFHNRLVRNDGTLRFPGLQHTGARPVHPARYIEAPIYHLDLVLTTQSERMEKARRYELSRPGLTCEDGRPLNETYYVPEWHARVTPASVSPPDGQAIAEVLSAPAPAPAPHPSSSDASGLPEQVQSRVVTRAEIERWWAPRPLGPDAYRATITPLTHAVRALAGRPRSVFVRVSNEGSETLPWGGDQPPYVRLGYRLLREGRTSLGEGPRSPLPADLAPGTSAIVPVSVAVPAAPGDYRLEIDLVHEHVRWFGCACSLRLHVAAGDEAAVARPLAAADDPR